MSINAIPEGRVVASMFPMGRRGRDMDYTRQVMSNQLRVDAPANQRRHPAGNISGLANSTCNATPSRASMVLHGRHRADRTVGGAVPTGGLLGGILSEWALGVPEKDLSLPIEPLAAAPLYMSFAPAMMLRYYRHMDRKASIRDGAPLPHLGECPMSTAIESISLDEGFGPTAAAEGRDEPILEAHHLV